MKGPHDTHRTPREWPRTATASLVPVWLVTLSLVACSTPPEATGPDDVELPETSTTDAPAWETDTASALAPDAEADSTGPGGPGWEEPDSLDPDPVDSGDPAPIVCDSAEDCAPLVAGSPCEVALCDLTKQVCVVGPVKDHTPCDDGSICTIGDHCIDGGCAIEAEVPCADGNLCTADSCHPLLGCVHDPKPDEPCDDGNGCTKDDTCMAGECVGAQDGTCVCDSDEDCAPLDDDDLCNGALVCSQAGFCVLPPESVVDCTSINDTTCLFTACNAETGQCEAKLPAGLPCFDGNVCTTGDTCGNGSCQPGPDACPCEQDADCAPFDDPTFDGIDLCNGALFCDGGLCRIEPATIVSCSPLDAAGCIPTLCEPTTGACEPAPKVDGAICDDDDPCTLDDVCTTAVCGGTPATCDSPGACLEAECNSETGACDPIPAHESEPCDDGNACTDVDACAAGQCGGVAVDCVDDNPCTDSTCDETSGCSFLPNTAPCDDASVCTVTDTCSDGACVPGSSLDCSDGVDCTTDTCDAVTGCASAADDTACPDDGVSCTTATCDATVGCVHGANDELCADDGLRCTSVACDPLLDCVHAPHDELCADTTDCTDDTCLLDVGCVYPPNDTNCDDGISCTHNVCDADQGCTFEMDDALCDDGADCTVGTCYVPEDCFYFKDHQACDDGHACSVDFCEIGEGCVYDLYDQWCSDDAFECTTTACVASEGCVQLTDPTMCDDDTDCTFDDCLVAAGCVNAPVDALCDDGSACTDDLCVSGKGCTAPLDFDLCDDGDSCNYDYCDPVTESCEHSSPVDAWHEVGFTDGVVGVMDMEIMPDGGVVILYYEHPWDSANPEPFHVVKMLRAGPTGDVLWDVALGGNDELSTWSDGSIALLDDAVLFAVIVLDPKFGYGVVGTVLLGSVSLAGDVMPSAPGLSWADASTARLSAHPTGVVLTFQQLNWEINASTGDSITDPRAVRLNWDLAVEQDQTLGFESEQSLAFSNVLLEGEDLIYAGVSSQTGFPDPRIEFPYSFRSDIGRVSASGAVVWRHSSTTSSGYRRLLRLDTATIAAVGWGGFGANAKADAYSLDGDLLWSVVDDAPLSFLNTAAVAGDGGLWMIASDYPSGTGRVHHISNTGAFDVVHSLAYFTIGDPWSHRFSAARPLDGGGFIAVGAFPDPTGIDTQDRDLRWVQFDANGLPPCGSL